MWCTMPPSRTLNPPRTLISERTPSSGASSGVISQFGPGVDGKKRSRRTPLPQYQIPKRTGIGVPSAWAVPFPLSIASRGGSPTAANIPYAAPWSNVRRWRVWRFISPRCGHEPERVVQDDRADQIGQAPPGVLEGSDQIRDGRLLPERCAQRVLVEATREARGDVGMSGEQLPELASAVEGLSVDLARGVDGEPTVRLPVHAQGVEVLEGEARWIHREMAALAGRIAHVLLDALPHRDVPVSGRLGQHRDHVAGRRRDLPAQQLR